MYTVYIKPNKRLKIIPKKEGGDKIKMAIYIALGKYTTEGIKAVENASKRYEKMKEMMSSVGAKYIATYATLGPYDFVYIIEGPDDPQKILQAEAKIAAMGAVTLQTFPAIPVEEFFKLLP